MESIRGSLLIINHKPTDVTGYIPETSADLFYEVIRVIHGKYLFLEDHLVRLHSSCSKHLDECPDKESISSQLNLLIDETGIREGNVKLLVYNTERQTNVVCYFTPHFYPDAKDYQLGVRVKSFAFERPDPNVKRWNEDFRNRVNQFIRDENIYEALLVNERGMLTEGSRSNLFFINGEKLITAPLKEILPGITRKYVLQICDELKIPILEQGVDARDVATMDGCFISGTSPKVLPVNKLDEIFFNPQNPLIKEIIATFNQLICDSLAD